MKINGNIVSCAGNFALRARCKVARGTSHFVLVASRAGNFTLFCALYFQLTARMPCRIFAKQSRIFAAQKYGSERAVSKIGYFFDSLSSLKLSLYITMT